MHQHPELSWEERETTNYICSLLDHLGLSYQRLDKTGLYVDFMVDPKKPIIIYRADIDALPIEEISDKDYKSKKKGIAHACGHDFHSTVAIALVKVLAKFKEQLKQNIRVLFQPAEEVVPSGAQSLVDSHVLNNVDYILAIHSEPNLEAGKISIVDGWVTTQYLNYYITLKGETGHVAHPYRSNDVIFTASQIITQLYAQLNRKNRYDEFFTMTFSMINSAKKINVIPDHLTLNGSLRISKKEKTEEIKTYIDNSIKTLAALNNVEVEINHVYGPPPVVNDPNLANKMRKIAKRVYKNDEISSQIRTMGSEDFSFYLERCKGCYFRVGVSNNTINHSLHSSRFDIDESIIAKTVHFISTICFESEN